MPGHNAFVPNRRRATNRTDTDTPLKGVHVSGVRPATPREGDRWLLRPTARFHPRRASFPLPLFRAFPARSSNACLMEHLAINKRVKML